MKQFSMNGILWTIVNVPPMSGYLVDRTGAITVGVTDARTKMIYLSSAISGDFRKRVIAHEMGHAVCFSYNLIGQIHRCCYPWKRIEMEEFVCNFVADYGERIFNLTYQIMGDAALEMLPAHLERMVS